MQRDDKIFHRSHKARKGCARKHFRNFLKCAIITCAPVPVALVMDAVWYFLLYNRNWDFGLFGHNLRFQLKVETEPLFHFIELIFSIFAAVIFDSVWKKARQMRRAARQKDWDGFMAGKDERISPLVHTFMFVQALIILVYQMLENQKFLDGVFAVFITAYLLALFFIVIKEMDDPSHGLWIIEEAEPRWREMEVDIYFSERENGHHRKQAAGMQ